MYFNTFAKMSLIPLLFAASALTGDETDVSTSDQKEAQTPISMGYNASCRIDPEASYDFFVSGSFIYWQPIQENMKLGVVSNSTDTDIVNGYEQDLSFKFKPGFKVGLGMNIDHDGWDTFMEYTWFHTTEKTSVNLDPTDITIGLLPAWQIPTFLNPQYNSGSENWRLKMDLLDWDLARSYSAGKNLCLRPFIGIRSAWIRQYANIDYVNTNASYELIWPSTSITQSARSWGIGPRLGIQSNWDLGAGFRINGSGEGDILYTQYNLYSEQSSTTTAANGYIVSQTNANYLRTHLDLELGLGWGSYLGSDTYHLDFSANYGFQVFFDQNMFRGAVSNTAYGVSTLPNGNLYVSGLTFAARFDF